MLHKIFFAQNRIVPTYAVTFTVKEFFLDPDNAFADTEVGVLQYMTVKIGATEVLTNASGQAVFNLTPGTYTYEVYDNARYLTTVKGEVTVVASAESVTAKVYPCLYKPTQVANMITPPAWAAGTYDEGWHVDYSGTIYVALLETSEEPGVGTDWEVTAAYIPVSTHGNLNDIRTAESRTMGQGTIFEGTFTTGQTGKKYIQCANIDLSSYANWAQIGPRDANETLTLTYNGNNLAINNLKITSSSQGLFGTTWGAKFYNIRINNADVSATLKNIGALSGGQGGNTDANNITEYKNILISNSKVTSTESNIGALTGQSLTEFLIVFNCHVYNCEVSGSINVGGLIGETYSEINNCSVVDTAVSGTGSSTGGFCGYNRKKITDSFAQNVTVNNTGGSFGCGGFTGTSFNTAVFQRVWSSGSVTHSGTGANGCGGLVGVLRSSSISNSFSHCTVSGITNVGGGIGQHRDATSTNCYSTGAVTGTTAVGGYSGVSTGSNTYTNSYYDSQTSGRSDTGKGLPRTTAQMKEGTASSFILPAGGTDPDSLAANAMYTSWDDIDTWDFGTTSEYPKLK